MASISGATSSNMTSSLYNSANVISGLASGLDTEGMIENLVKSYQLKINQLNQNVTKTEWKQEAYRSIISKMVGFSQKYTSYNSPATNLLSPSFFSNAVKVATQGLYKDKVTASGKTSSDISINAVHQLATSAQYRVGDGRLNSGDGKSIQSASDIDLLGKTTLGALQGSMTVVYGSQKLNINFDEVADKKALEEIEKSGKTGADALAELINQKLEGQKITFSNGQSEKAEDRVKAVVKGGSIVFEDQKASAGNALYISQASGNVAKTLGLDLDKASEEKNINSFSLDGLKDADGKVKLTREEDNLEYLSGKVLSMNLNGASKNIYLPTLERVAGENEGDPETYKINGKAVDKDNLAAEYAKAVNEEVGKAFKGKIEVSNVGTDGKLKLNFKVKEDGSDLRINSDVGEALGIGQTATTYLNTSSTLEKLLGDRLSSLPSAGKDDKGNDLYALEINGVTVGKYTKDAKLSDILNDINSNKNAGVKVSYSQTTKEFLFSAKETGADSEIKIGGGLAEAMFGSTEIPDNSNGSFTEAYGISWLKDGESERVTFAVPGGGSYSYNITTKTTINDVIDDLNDAFQQTAVFSYNKQTGQMEAKAYNSEKSVDFTMMDSYGDPVVFDESKAPKIDYTAGQDAKFTATINGKEMEMTRSSNSVSIDGLTINMKETFDASVNEDGTKASAAQRAENSVTFKSTTDSDKIVDAVKSMIEDYNAMLSEIRSAYSTLPAQKSDKSSYEPLTEDDMEGMSESAIQRYEEKAKQGILFADRDLSSLYNKLQSMFSPAGQDGAILRGMGITSSYDIGTGALNITLDEDKLRAMLDSDPDMVADAFTKTNGGVMQNLKTTLDAYAKTSGEPKGILIQKAGSPLSPLSLMNNTWQKQIDNYNTQIEKWQDKLSSQVDRYTQQFSRLEQLIQQMNSQSSALAGMMGG